MKQCQITAGLIFIVIFLLMVPVSFATELPPGNILDPLGSQFSFRCAYSPVKDEYLIALTGYRSPSTLPRALVVHLSPSGVISDETYLSAATYVQNHDIVYNPDRDEYLAVWRNDDGSIYATYLNGDGNEKGNEFLVAGKGRAVSVDYSAGSRRYMIVYLIGSSLHYQMVDGDSSSTSPKIGGAVSVQTDAFGPSMSYGSVSDKFLITFNQEVSGGNTDDIFGRFVNSYGTVGPRFRIYGDNDVQQGPRIAYAPSVDRWLVAFSDWSDGERDAMGALVNSDNSIFKIFTISNNGAVWDIPHAVTYQPNVDKFFVVWRNEPHGYAKEVDPATGAMGTRIHLSDRDVFMDGACSRDSPSGPQFMVVWRMQVGINRGIHAGIINLPSTAGLSGTGDLMEPDDNVDRLWLSGLVVANTTAFLGAVLAIILAVIVALPRAAYWRPKR